MRSGAVLILACFGLSPVSVALAQLGPSEPGAPISIQADNGLEWQQNQQLYIARGNAFAARGPATVKANTLIAHYREAKAGAPNPNSSTASTGGNSEIYRVEADGNVVITRDTRTIAGDHADYDMDQGIGIVRGKNLKMTTPTDVITAKDAFEWYDQKQVAVARGDAVATRQNNRTIKADTLTAYMVKVQPQGSAPGQPAKPGAAPAKPVAQPVKGAQANGPPGNAAPVAGEESKINRIDAQGHVVVVNGPDIGRGDYGVYNAVSNICTLLGNVTITRGADVITGQYAVMDMNNNVSRIMPASSLPGSTRQRVQGLFVKQDLDHKAAQNKPGENKPGETKSSEAKPGEAKPSETKPGESKKAQ
jgi:lipopolysaccharide export system protein LptA